MALLPSAGAAPAELAGKDPAGDGVNAMAARWPGLTRAELRFRPRPPRLGARPSRRWSRSSPGHRTGNTNGAGKDLSHFGGLLGHHAVEGGPDEAILGLAVQDFDVPRGQTDTLGDDRGRPCRIGLLSSATIIRRSRLELDRRVQRMLRFPAHFRAAVVVLGGGRGVAFRQRLGKIQTPPRIGQEDLVLLAFGVEEQSAGRSGGGNLGFGLDHEFAQTLPFGGGYGDIGLTTSRMVASNSPWSISATAAAPGDKIRLGRIQPGEPAGELGGEHRLPVGDHITGGGEIGDCRSAFRPVAAETLTTGEVLTSTDCSRAGGRGARTAPAAMASATAHTQGDTRRRRRERSMFRAAKCLKTSLHLTMPDDCLPGDG